jgi:hypothetical protein
MISRTPDDVLRLFENVGLCRGRRLMPRQISAMHNGEGWMAISAGLRMLRQSPNLMAGSYGAR